MTLESEHREPVFERVDVLTPEGVVFQIELAGIGTRFLGAVVDLSALTLVVTVVFWAVTITGTTIPPGFLNAAIVTGVFALIFFYGLFCEQVFAGRSLGKLATQTRVISGDGGTVSPSQSAIRAVLWPFEILMLPILGLGTALVTQHSQRLGDLGGGTFVMRNSTKVRVGSRVAPTWAAHEPNAAFRTWDMTTVDPADVAIARQFLSRRNQLAPGARASLAAQLNARMRPRVLGPDHTWPDELFIEAVVAAKSISGS